MTKEKKSYYAIIPANVRYDSRLSPYARLLFGEITALSNEKGFCWASNGYFAKLYGVTKQAISKWMKSLETCEYISIKYKRDGAQIIERRVSITVDTYQPQIKGVSTSNVEGYQPAIEDNTTKRILNINKKDVGKKQFDFLLKIENLESEYQDFKSLLKEWLIYRNEIKKPLASSLSIVKMLKKWKEIGIKTAQSKVDKAIANSWQGWDHSSGSTSNQSKPQNQKDDWANEY